MTSPLVVARFLSADDNVPSKRDGDFDDLEVAFEHLDPAFEVVQRPFALERGSLTMLPDGIFDASQGVQYRACGSATRGSSTGSRPSRRPG